MNRLAFSLLWLVWSGRISEKTKPLDSDDFIQGCGCPNDTNFLDRVVFWTIPKSMRAGLNVRCIVSCEIRRPRRRVVGYKLSRCCVYCYRGDQKPPRKPESKADMGRHGPRWAEMGRHGPTWADMGQDWPTQEAKFPSTKLV